MPKVTQIVDGGVKIQIPDDLTPVPTALYWNINHIVSPQSVGKKKKFFVKQELTTLPSRTVVIIYPGDMGFFLVITVVCVGTIRNFDAPI